MTDDEVVFSRAGSVGLVRLNRPKKLNAVTPRMARLLSAYLTEVEDDPSLRATVISGAGDRAFCTGADLSVVANGEADQLATERGGHFGLIRFARTKPLVGAVHGYTIAGGLELAMACDILVAERGVVFGLPELKRGILPNGGGLTRLSSLIPRKTAYEVIFAGRQLNGEEALAFGLINRLVEPGTGLKTAQSIAEDIAANPAPAVEAGMRILRAVDESATDPLWDLSVVIASSIRKSDQARSLARDFVEGGIRPGHPQP